MEIPTATTIDRLLDAISVIDGLLLIRPILVELNKDSSTISAYTYFRNNDNMKCPIWFRKKFTQIVTDTKRPPDAIATTDGRICPDLAAHMCCIIQPDLDHDELLAGFHEKARSEANRIKAIKRAVEDDNEAIDTTKRKVKLARGEGELVEVVKSYQRTDQEEDTNLALRMKDATTQLELRLKDAEATLASDAIERAQRLEDQKEMARLRRYIEAADASQKLAAENQKLEAEQMRARYEEAALAKLMDIERLETTNSSLTLQNEAIENNALQSTTVQNRFAADASQITLLQKEQIEWTNERNGLTEICTQWQTSGSAHQKANLQLKHDMEDLQVTMARETAHAKKFYSDMGLRDVEIAVLRDNVKQLEDQLDTEKQVSARRGDREKQIDDLRARVKDLVRAARENATYLNDHRRLHEAQIKILKNKVLVAETNQKNQIDKLERRKAMNAKTRITKALRAAARIEESKAVRYFEGRVITSDVNEYPDYMNDDL